MRRVIKNQWFISLMWLCVAALSLPQSSNAADYKVDTLGAHAFIQFRVKHLGFSWLYGRFNTFHGEFHFNRNAPEKSQIEVTIDTSSIDSNHGLRDKILRGKKFLNVKEYPKARFVSTKYEVLEDNMARLTGNLTLRGQTHPVQIEVEHIGGGRDPWGGYREGFEGRATIKPDQWGIPMVDKLGAESAEVELMLTVEGIRKKKENKFKK